MASDPNDREFELKKAAISIDLVIHRLQTLERTLKAQADTHFKQTVESVQKGENARATIYADEVASLRNLSQKLYYAETILERVKTRFEVASIVSPIGENLRVANQLLSEVRTTFSSLSLSLNEIADIHDEVNEVMKITEAREAPGISVIGEPEKEEVKEILSQAQARAAERIAKEFPPVPTEAMMPEASLEDRLYEYLVKREGALSLSEASKDLGESEEQVRKALKSLREKNRISLDEREMEKG